jgi:histone acetyltransferase (RNA polymerase elongator complex component)
MNKYKGYEVGPIRPPSESNSLMLRVSRNCSWNKCRFCTLYKNTEFSIRKKEEVLKDIDILKAVYDEYSTRKKFSEINIREILTKFNVNYEENSYLKYMFVSWYQTGMQSVFLQDANSLLYRPNDFIEILQYLRKNFPEIERVTAYARSQTIVNIDQNHLNEMQKAGLNRIHIGMESASDNVLERINKGADKEIHITAGKKVRKAGIELSEYFMPGLGGNEFSEENALETADALNLINPNFIRIRTLAVKENSLLDDDYKAGVFTRTSDVQMVKELRLLIENLNGITSTLKSDHIINLLPEVEGEFPKDKEKMLSVIDWFLNLSDEKQMIFIVGRRTMTINTRDQFKEKKRRDRTLRIIKENEITKENLTEISNVLMNRFI